MSVCSHGLVSSVVMAAFHRLPRKRQDQLIVLGYFCGGTVLYCTGIYPVLDQGSAPIWLRIAVLAVMCAFQLLRRRAPVIGLCLAMIPLTGDVVLGTSAPILIALGDHLYCAVLYSSQRVGRVVTTLAVLGTLVGTAVALTLVPNWRLAIFVVVACAPFIVIPVWWAANIRQHRIMAESERAVSAQLARIADLDRKADVVAERARMARDLHDVVAGHLSAIAIQSEAALSIKDPDSARKVLTLVRENSVSALTEMRSIITLLRADGSGVDESTSPPRLNELSKLVESARAAGMRVDVHNTLSHSAVPLPAAVDLAAYRIAQEALTNAIKHAPGARASVAIQHSEGTLTLEVSNELAGQARRGSGVGLLSMRERAIAIGGSFSAGPVPRGWMVRAVLPVGDPA